jgi:hypothetical protein
MHAGGDAEELDRLIARIQVLRKDYARDSLPFEIHAISLDGFTLDGVKLLEDQGVTDVIVAFRDLYQRDAMTPEEKVGAIEEFANNVIAKI